MPASSAAVRGGFNVGVVRTLELAFPEKCGQRLSLIGVDDQGGASVHADSLLAVRVSLISSFRCSPDMGTAPTADPLDLSRDRDFPTAAITTSREETEQERQTVEEGGEEDGHGQHSCLSAFLIAS